MKSKIRDHVREKLLKKRKTSVSLKLPKKFIVAPDERSGLVAYPFDEQGNVVVSASGPISNGAELESISLTNKLNTFLDSDLPMLLQSDENFQDLARWRTAKTSSFRLIRDLEVPITVGSKSIFTSAPTIHHRDRSVLPSLPNLVYEDYPLFRPSQDSSTEMTNDEFIDQFLTPFRKVLKERVKVCTVPIHSLNLNFEDFQTPASLIEPVEYDDYMELMNDKIWAALLDVFLLIIYDKKKLVKFLDEVYDGYIPILTPTSPVNLKPIGVVADVPFTWGIFDNLTRTLNKLLVHVEVLDIRLGVSEGYELCLGAKPTGEHMIGSDFTKRDNFLKRFTKCIAICLNSHTRRFIMTDYYWCGCFQIDDIMDGEIEDATKLLSKVKLLHFSHYNFDMNNTLTIRNVIASFLYMTPETSIRDTELMSKLNKRVAKEWKSFQLYDSLVNRDQRRSTPSPVKYSTVTGLTFTMQRVDLDRATLGFIAVGSLWSCQTILVDVSKLFVDQSHLKYDKEGLLSVYDEYYQEHSALMFSRHLSTPASRLELSGNELRLIARDLVIRWSSNVQAYQKLRTLQGKCIARMLDFGVLEDKKYNEDVIHFRCDGYYILFEPITKDNDDLKPLDPENAEHRSKAFDTINNIHALGVTFHPHSELSPDVLKWANDKVYVINLERTSFSGISEADRRRDLVSLRRMFERQRTDL